MSNKVILLTDEVIDRVTDKVVYDSHLHLLRSTHLTCPPGSLVDSNIFGSPVGHRCTCGAQTTPGKCFKCGQTVLSSEEEANSYAKIELPTFTCNNQNWNRLINTLKAYGVDCANAKGERSNLTKLTNVMMSAWSIVNNQLVRDPKLTNENVEFAGLEGLVKVIAGTDMEKDIRPLVNNRVLVLGYSMRRSLMEYKDTTNTRNSADGIAGVKYHPLTIKYNLILHAIDEYNKVKDSLDPLNAYIRRAYLAMTTSSIMSDASGLLTDAKSNFARIMQSRRAANSGRCVILPADPSVKPNEIELPIHLAYEAFAEEFMMWMRKNPDIPCTNKTQALRLRASINTNPSVMQWFNQFIDGEKDENGNYIANTGKYVLINRAPTLYQYGVMCMKVKLTNDYCMKLPQAVLTALNADFDGD